MKAKKNVFKVACLIALVVVTVSAKKEPHALLQDLKWIHGSENCKLQADPLIQVVQYNENTWILRQNKCVHFEAPFMYLFVGKDKALLVDTGASKSEAVFPLYDAINGIVQGKNKKERKLPLVIAHSHSHSDHHAADSQFEGKPNVTIVGLSVEDVKKYFGFVQPGEAVTMDLGERVLDVISIPGHHATSIAFYDRSSKLLLTGDTFYPGRLYVDDWSAFKKSIARLYDFAVHHEVEYIVGSHIEMSMSAEVDYPTGSTYHPEEQRLPLTVEELGELNASLKTTTDQPERMVFRKFIVSPK